MKSKSKAEQGRAMLEHKAGGEVAGEVLPRQGHHGTAKNPNLLSSILGLTRIEEKKISNRPTQKNRIKTWREFKESLSVAGGSHTSHGGEGG